MPGTLEIPVLIARKRDGGELRGEDIRDLVDGYLAGDVAEEQMAALLMAGVIRGFTEQEAIAFTESFLDSGETIDLSDLAGPTVDKHSTGGVGDTTTLVVGPMLAAAGLQVAKLSGRGLGHTGGTLDKLEAIPGFRVDLEPAELHAQVEDIGLAVAAATADLVPADKRIYALRDITGTVASPALIAASVMSKKLAGGADTIVLDVKTGDGAFMESVEAATDLARLCVGIGRAHGRRTAALVTDMSQPLGVGVGNAIEVAVAVEVLRGERDDRLAELSRTLVATALELVGRPPREAEATAAEVLASGEALDRFRRFVAAQGGDPAVADDPRAVLPAAPVVREWAAPGGTVERFATRRLGELAALLGAGRQRPGAAVDPAVGLEVLPRIGDAVPAGETVVRVHARSEEDAERVLAELPDVVGFVDGPVDPVPLVAARLGTGTDAAVDGSGDR